MQTASIRKFECAVSEAMGNAFLKLGSTSAQYDQGKEKESSEHVCNAFDILYCKRGCPGFNHWWTYRDVGNLLVYQCYGKNSASVILHRIGATKGKSAHYRLGVTGPLDGGKTWSHCVDLAKDVDVWRVLESKKIEPLAELLEKHKCSHIQVESAMDRMRQWRETYEKILSNIDLNAFFAVCSKVDSVN